MNEMDQIIDTHHNGRMWENEGRMSLPHYCQSGQAHRLAILTLMRQTHLLLTDWPF